MLNERQVRSISATSDLQAVQGKTEEIVYHHQDENKNEAFPRHNNDKS